MDIKDIHNLADIFDNKVRIYKKACDFILKSDTKKDLKKLRKQILKKVVENERKN